MNVALHPAPMTTEAFLAWPGDGSGRRFNLVDGIARPMSPASPTHSVVQANACMLVANAVDAAGLDLTTLIEGAIIPGRQPSKNVRVPDVLVCSTPVEQGSSTVAEPILAIEVLSPGNEKQTRDNAQSYTSVPTMREVVLIHSQRMLAEVQRRGVDGMWTTDTVEPGGELVLATVALRCPVEALYRRTWLVRS